MSERRVTDEAIGTAELIESILPAEMLPPGDPVLEQDLDGMEQRQGYGGVAPGVGISESAMTAAHMIPPADVQKKPHNELNWVAEHLGYPQPHGAQRAPEGAYSNPGRGR